MMFEHIEEDSDESSTSTEKEEEEEEQEEEETVKLHKTASDVKNEATPEPSSNDQILPKIDMHNRNPQESNESNPSHVMFDDQASVTTSKSVVSADEMSLPTKVNTYIARSSRSLRQDAKDDSSVSSNTSQNSQRKSRVLNLTKAERMEEIGRINMQSDNFDQALEAFSLALRVKTQILSKNDISFASTIECMGDVYLEKGELSKGLKAYEEVVRLRRIHVEQHIDNEEAFGALASSLCTLAQIIEDQGDLDRALVIRDEELGATQRRYGEHEKTADVIENIGMIFLEKGQYEESLTYFLQSLRMKRKLLGNDSVASTLTFVGNVFFAKAEYDNAMDAFNEALEIRIRIMGEAHLETSRSLSNIGNVYMAIGKYDQALQSYVKALKIRQAQVGDEHLYVASSQNDVGDAQAALKEYGPSLKSYSSALRLYRKWLGDRHEDVAAVYSNMATVHERRKEFDKARQKYIKSANINLANRDIEEALENFIKALNLDMSDALEEQLVIVKKVMWIAFLLQWKQEDVDKAKKAYEECLHVFRVAMKDSTNDDVATALESIAFIQMEKQDFKGALQNSLEALRVKRLMDEKDVKNVPLLNQIALLYEIVGEPDQALEKYNEVLKVKKHLLGEDHISTAATQNHIGIILGRKGEHRMAIELLQNALMVLKTNLGENHHSIASVHAHIGDVYYHTYKHKHAIDAYKKAVQLITLRNGEDVRVVQWEENPTSASSELAELHFKLGQNLAAIHRYSEAIEEYKESLRLRKLIQRYDLFHVANLMNFLAEAHFGNKEFEKAKNAYDESLKIRKELVDKEKVKTGSTVARSYFGAEQVHYEPTRDLLQALENVVMTLCGIALWWDSQGKQDNVMVTFEAAALMLRSQSGSNIIEAKLKDKMGTFQTNNERYDRALRLYEDAILLRNKTDVQHIGNADSHKAMGDIYLRQNNYEQALKSFHNVLTIKVSNLGPDHYQIVSCHEDIGSVYFQQAEYMKALTSFKESLRVTRIHLGDKDEKVARILLLIAPIHEALHNFNEAIEVYSGCGAIFQENSIFSDALNAYIKAIHVNYPTYSAEHEKVCRKLHAFGQILYLKGELQLAKEAYEQVLQVFNVVSGDDHMDVVSTREVLGDIHGKQLDYSHALEAYSEVMRVKKQKFGDESMEVARLLGKIADIYHHQPNFERAIDTYNDVLYLYQKILGADHISVAATIRHIGQVHRSKKDLVEAMGYFNNALAKLKSKLGENSLSIALLYSDIGDTHFEEKSYNDAIESYDECLRVRTLLLGNYHLDIADTLDRRGRSLAADDQLDEAIAAYEESLRVRTFLDDKTASMANTLDGLGKAYVNRGNVKEAIDAYEDALQIRKEILDKAIHSASSSVERMGRLDARKEQYRKQAVKNVIATLSNIGALLEEEKRLKKAMDTYQECLKLEKHLSTDDMIVLYPIYLRVGEISHDIEDDETSQLKNYELALGIQKSWMGIKKDELAETVKRINGVFYKTDNYDSALNSFKSSQYETASLSFKIGVCHKELKNYNEGLSALRESLRYSETLDGADHLDLVPVHDMIGQTHFEFENYKSALDSFTECLRIQKLNLSEHHLDLANTLEQMAKVYEATEEYEAVISTLQEVVRIKLLADDGTLANTYVKMGDVYRLMGQNEDAAEAYQFSLHLRRSDLYQKRQSLRTSIRNLTSATGHDYHNEAVDIKHKAKEVAAIMASLDEVSNVRSSQRDVIGGISRPDTESDKEMPSLTNGEEIVLV